MRMAQRNAEPMTRLHPLALAAALLLAAPPALASPELARAKNCIACHHETRRVIGPTWNAVAQRYANDGTAVQVLSARIVAGNGGVWGETPMPAQDLTPAEAEALVRWILTLR
jgi:cytochrome c